MAAKNASMPQTGSLAPDFTLPSSAGDNVTLSDLKGRPIVVYFYPKDDTPGCTVEAKGFQAQAPAFADAGAHVLGISPDGVTSHCKFAEKYGLEFPLLADENHEVAEAYGVWVEKNNYGRKSMGIQRATFLINAEGIIAEVWPRVKPDGHPEEVLAAIKAL